MKRFASAALAFLLLVIPMDIAYSAGGSKPQHCFREGRNGIVCLTFDDGAVSSKNLGQVLDILRSNHVQCTFFIIGKFLKIHADIWRQAVLDGHEICYHTMTHDPKVLKNAQSIRKDISAWNDTAHEVLGDDYNIPKLARLPGGNGEDNPRVVDVYNREGYSVIGWDVDPLTGAYDASAASSLTWGQKVRRTANYVRNWTKPNSIVLFHFSSRDIAILPDYIDWLKSRYTLGKVSDAIALTEPNTISAPVSDPYSGKLYYKNGALPQ